MARNTTAKFQTENSLTYVPIFNFISQTGG